MAPNYKLTYFNLTGRAEPIRLILSYAGIQFEDNRFELAEWPKVKPTMPFGQVPVLEIDGKPYTQAMPLCRYLGNILQLAGKDPQENLAIDSAVEMLWDVLKSCYERKWEPEEERQKKLGERINALFPIILGRLEEDTKKNNGYIAVNRISWADLVFLAAYEDLENMIPEKPFTKCPGLQKLKSKLLENQNIKDYIQKRPTNQIMSAYNLKNDL